MNDKEFNALIDEIKFDDRGLIPAIAVEEQSGEALMMAWMNKESIRLSIKEGKGIYYSRSRNAIWRKGETSGNAQILRSIYLDCDGDTLLLKVTQQGVACHTGRRTCFYRKLEDNQWKDVVPVAVNPEELYGKKNDE